MRDIKCAVQEDGIEENKMSKSLHRSIQLGKSWVPRSNQHITKRCVQLLVIQFELVSQEK